MIENLPKHVGIIADGNRRWSTEKGLPTLAGHKKGADQLVELSKTARDLGIHTLTFWVWSAENWTRTQEEIDYLMGLFRTYIKKFKKDAQESNARFIHLGRKDRIPADLAAEIADLEEESKNNTKHVLNIALDYGGHDEIMRTTQRIIEKVQNGEITKESIFEQVDKYHGKYPMYKYKDFLDTKDQPNPYVDLLIRTSGEHRLSGFLPWQAVYAEFYFPDFNFPDFTPEKLKEAIEEFSKRNRRFGGNDQAHKAR